MRIHGTLWNRCCGCHQGIQYLFRFCPRAPDEKSEPDFLPGGACLVEPGPGQGHYVFEGVLGIVEWREQCLKQRHLSRGVL